MKPSQDQVNETAANLHQKTEQPKNDQDHQDGPKHGIFSFEVMERIRLIKLSLRAFD